jgi:hypothetical protein
MLPGQELFRVVINVAKVQGEGKKIGKIGISTHQFRANISLKIQNTSNGQRLTYQLHHAV